MTPFTAWADAVRITSGEHATFSRIVIYFLEPVIWRFGRSENGYVFEYDRPFTTFQAEEVFRFIPRRRLLDLEIDSVQNQIQLIMKCECNADAFELRDGQIVLDFKDGAPDEYSRFEAPLGAPKTSVQPADQVTLNVAAPEVSRPFIRIPVTEAPVPDLGNALTIGQVEILQSALLENLSRAMSQGMVETQRPNMNEDPIEQGDLKSDFADVSRANNDTTLRQTVQDPMSGVSFQTQIDLDAARRSEQTQEFNAQCPSPALLDVSNWGEPDRMLEGLAQRRHDLVSPALLFSQDSSLTLARYYVWLGFGAEARAVLVLSTPDDQTMTDAEEAVHIMSGVIDALPISGGSAWRECHGAAQMWAFLADAGAESPLPPAKMNIIRVFEGLPNHLKHHLGPMLFDRFIAVEDKDAAESIRRSMSRSIEHRSSQVELLEAKALLDSGDIDTALQLFSGLAKGSDAIAIQALIMLAEASLPNGTILPDWALEGLRAQASVYKGTPDGVPIRDLLLAHLVAEGRIAEVLSYLKQAPFETTLEDQARLLSLLEAALPKADDTIFAELAVRNRGLIRSTPAAAALRSYTSNRFETLGFAAIAATFAMPMALGDGDTVPAGLQETEITAPKDSQLTSLSDQANQTPRTGAPTDIANSSSTQDDLLSRLSAVSTLPPIDQTVVSIPENQDLLAAARARRQLVNDLLATLPEVD
jgi:hypothetical protein